MYNITHTKFRLKSRKIFLKTSRVRRKGGVDQERIKRWRQNIRESNEYNTVTIEPKEELDRGKTLPWNLWRTNGLKRNVYGRKRICSNGVRQRMTSANVEEYKTINKRV